MSNLPETLSGALLDRFFDDNASKVSEGGKVG